MTNRSLLSLFALAGVLTFSGCNKSLEDQLNENATDTEQLTACPATLIKKEVVGRHRGSDSLLYFDLDGNPDTTELVMRKERCCLSVLGKLNDAKPGETKTIQEWYNQITQHKGCTSNYYRRFKADVQLMDR